MREMCIEKILNLHGTWKNEFDNKKMAVFKIKFKSRVYLIQNSKLMEVLKVLVMVFCRVLRRWQACSCRQHSQLKLKPESYC